MHNLKGAMQHAHSKDMFLHDEVLSSYQLGQMVDNGSTIIRLAP